MRREGSLRGRIVAAYALLAVAVCGFFAIVVFFAVQEVEKYLVQKRLASIAEWHIARQQQGVGTELPPGLAVFAGAAIPAAMRALPPGFHELAEGRRTVHVLVGAGGNGERFAAVDEISDFERIEREILRGLVAGILVSALLAALLGRMTASRVIKPVTALADAVTQDTLDERAPSIALNDEIGVLARAFAARSTELRRFLARERLFTGDVSHELRTPLTVILGAAEVLSVRLDDRPELLAIVKRIQRTAQDTTDRVGALLLLSRAPEALDAPRLALVPLVEREIERCRPLLASKPVQLVFEQREETWIFARAELVEMAIGNLLRNACQYTEQGKIEVRLKAGSLVIEDTGPGLPGSVRAQLFDRFVRGADDRESGAGLGLAIVKRIVEHLGWEVQLEDREVGGSRFVLTFADQFAPQSPA